MRAEWLSAMAEPAEFCHPSRYPWAAQRNCMIREELVFVATCDISGHVRGKGFPARELKARSEGALAGPAAI
jgi:hypothetical protein